jgi:hypothetical protein
MYNPPSCGAAAASGAAHAIDTIAPSRLNLRDMLEVPGFIDDPLRASKGGMIKKTPPKRGFLISEDRC